MIPVEDSTSLALLYHINSKPWTEGNAFVSLLPDVQYKEMSALGEPVVLTRPSAESLLNKLLNERQSQRSFRECAMPLNDLSTLLSGTYATTQLRLIPGGFSFLSRTVPSAGGLYPLEVYVVTQQLQDTCDGIYHYNILDHNLELLRKGNFFSELSGHLANQYFFAGANAVVIFSAVFKRTLRKYGARGYRYILLEAGHAAQNLCLLATEQKLGTLCMGGFDDSGLNCFLGIDGVAEAAIYCVAVGYAAEQ